MKLNHALAITAAADALRRATDSLRHAIDALAEVPCAHDQADALADGLSWISETWAQLPSVDLDD